MTHTCISCGMPAHALCGKRDVDKSGVNGFSVKCYECCENEKKDENYEQTRYYGTNDQEEIGQNINITTTAGIGDMKLPTEITTRTMERDKYQGMCSNNGEINSSSGTRTTSSSITYDLNNNGL